MTRILLTTDTPSAYNTYTISETCGNYLYSSFCQLYTNCEFLPKEHVGIMGLLKSTFQLLQLEIGKCGAVPTLLPFADDAGWSLFAFRASREIIRYKKTQFIRRDNTLPTGSSRYTTLVRDKDIGVDASVTFVIVPTRYENPRRGSLAVGFYAAMFRGHVGTANAS